MGINYRKKGRRRERGGELAGKGTPVARGAEEAVEDQSCVSVGFV